MESVSLLTAMAQPWNPVYHSPSSLILSPIPGRAKALGMRQPGEKSRAGGFLSLRLRNDRWGELGIWDSEITRHPVTTAPSNPPKGVGADQRVRPLFLLREGARVVAHAPRDDNVGGTLAPRHHGTQKSSKRRRGGPVCPPVIFIARRRSRRR